jgi:adenylate kinase family enzyme
MRIAILGNSGSGKSTLARWLSLRGGAVVLDLDTVAWEPNQVAVPREPGAAQAEVAAFCAAHANWVVEGCYASLVAATFPHRPSLLFLDPGVEACLANCRARPWEPNKYASKAEQDERLAFLLTWVREYYIRKGDMSLEAHQALFTSYNGPKQRLSNLWALDPAGTEMPWWAEGPAK